MIDLRRSYEGEYDAALVDALCEGLRLQPLTARALIRRGIRTIADAERFLHPERLPLRDPFDSGEMRRAVERLRTAFLEDESICVYGDYDADGICATAILLDCFREYTEKAFAYIPSRHTEGYGLHESAVRALHARGVQLIVTVDNGISAHDEAALCRELGMELIVTDHHSVPETLPDCAAIVMPPDEACGAGVALRLARALSGNARLDRWLPLAAVATVADVVPLVDDNRVLVARGLPLIEENMGLRALLRVAAQGENAVDASTLAFLIAPRLNAAGRLGDAMRGVSLLLATDIHTADRLAAELNETNTRRRAIETAILAQAEEMLSVESQPIRRAVLLRHPSWNVGVIGIVASRLSEKMHCPAILLSEDENGILTGSGRSFGDIDLHATLTACAKHFIRFGGHAAAAGLTMCGDRFQDFCDDFLAYLCEHYGERDLLPSKRYDEALPLSELTLASVAQLKLLAPFGAGNPEPVYRFDGVRLSELRRMGQDGRHVSARAVQDRATLRVVGFGFGERFEELQAAGRWTLIARPSVHSYRGMESVELMLDDVWNEEKLFDDFFLNVLYNIVCVESCGFSIPRTGEGCRYDDASMRAMYAALQGGIDAEGLPVETAMARFDRDTLLALLVFLELGFFIRDGDSIRLAPDAQRRSLSESRIYGLIQSKDKREDSSWT